MGVDGLKIAFDALIRRLNNFSFVVTVITTGGETENCRNDTDGTQGNKFLILIQCSSDFHHNGCAEAEGTPLTSVL